MTNRYERPRNFGDSLKALAGILIVAGLFYLGSRHYHAAQYTSGQVPSGFNAMTVKSIYPAFKDQGSNPDYLVRTQLFNGQEELYTLGSRTFVNVTEAQKNIMFTQLSDALEKRKLIKCSGMQYSNVNYLVACDSQ